MGQDTAGKTPLSKDAPCRCAHVSEAGVRFIYEVLYSRGFGGGDREVKEMKNIGAEGVGGGSFFFGINKGGNRMKRNGTCCVFWKKKSRRNNQK